MKKTSQPSKTKPILLFDIDYTLFNTDHLKKTNLAEFILYEEVNEVLKQLATNAILGILSEGTTSWQQKKLKETQIAHIFIEEHTYIVGKKIDMAKSILEKYQTTNSIFLIDDKLTFLYEAKGILPSLKTVWIKRGIYAMNQAPIPKFKPDFTIDTLKALTTIIS